jgi:phosphopantothenoylcysteine decarboxylase / phosphopantothenate---cysteine ligase
MANQKRILLIIGGGVAAYKALELIRILARRGVATRAILTAGGAQFVTPLSVAALSGEQVHQELFDLTSEAEMGHIELSRSADLVVVCPATADLIAKAANGLANDLASTALLATDKPVLMAPAMNVRMWEHAAVKRNVARLRADGVFVMEPDVGPMACGEFGPGRLPEPERIAEEILQRLHPAEIGPLAGFRAVVTAGPTREPLDPVRYISNQSSGQQGFAIATALAELGAAVRLLSGPVALPDPPGVETVRVETALEMHDAVKASLPADVFVSVAAVADWRPAQPAEQKLKLKGAGGKPVTVELVENPDILKSVASARKDRPRLVVGFAAETSDVEAHARAKLRRKACDWIIANDVSGDVMGGAENEVLLVTRADVERWPRLPKTEVARRIAERIAEAFYDPEADGTAHAAE